VLTDTRETKLYKWHWW